MLELPIVCAWQEPLSWWPSSAVAPFPDLG
jgi:hypothetical protein